MSDQQFHASHEQNQQVQPEQPPRHLSTDQQIASMAKAMEEDGKVERKQDGIEPTYTEADFEDLKASNTPTARLFVQTVKIDPTPLNDKRIQVRVIDGSLKSGGIFSASYLLFTVVVEPIGWKIQRKDQDFYFLRKILLKEFPYMIIPPLPIKKKKETDKSIRRREKYLSRFMQAIMRSEDLKSS